MKKLLAFAFTILLAGPAFAVRTALTVVPSIRAGVSVSFTSCDLVNGNSFMNDGQTVLMVRNTGASPVSLTIRTSVIIDGDLVVQNRVVAVPVSTAAAPAFMLGAFLVQVYNQVDGHVWLDCAAALLIVPLNVQ